LLLALLAAVVLVLLWTAPLAVLDAVTAAAEGSRPHATDDVARLIATVVIVALVALSGIAAWAAVSSPRRPVRLARGHGTMQVAAIGAQLGAALRERADIEDATVEVANRHRRGIEVAATIEVTPDARLAETIPAAVALIEAAARYQLDIALAAAPAVRVHYRELRLMPRRHAAARHAELWRDADTDEDA